jgi:hypothetical protein
VQRLVLGPSFEKRIEKRTVAKPAASASTDAASAPAASASAAPLSPEEEAKAAHKAKAAKTRERIVRKAAEELQDGEEC